VARVTIETRIDDADGATYLKDVYQLVAGDEMTVEIVCATEAEDHTCTPFANTVVSSQPRPFEDD
jgi:hypothetical protein